MADEPPRPPDSAPPPGEAPRPPRERSRPPDAPDPGQEWSGPGRWWGGPGGRDAREWDRAARRQRWRARRGRGPGGVGFIGCFIVALVLFIATITATATWVAAALLGVIAPGAAPSAATAVAVVVVLVIAVVLAARAFASTIRPLAALGEAAERLADGEPDVRVTPRGPGPVRGLAASFNAMAERLDRSQADRRALLADVTHELRTPLTVVAGGIEAMLDGIHPMDEDHLSPLLAETSVMDRLLEDLRTLSLAEAGALPLYREPVDLRALAEEVVAAHQPRASSDGLTLSVAGDGPVVTSVDPVRVREILGNLVSNALRHTPAGGAVTIDVGTDGGEALLVVRDTGEGIPAADLPRVFDRFHRRADSGGSGLGLAIVRDLAAAHGGSVSVESDGVPGRGSVFRVRLPVRD
jgi:two-component system, OmpR family, sensor histidine kinase BaeS